MNISTNPLHAFEQSFNGLALTKYKVESIEIIITKATKKFFELQDKNDMRGYRHEVARETIKRAHYRTTILGKFSHLDSLSDILKEVEFTKSNDFLHRLIDTIEFNKEDQFNTKLPKAFTPLLIPTLVLEVLYAIVDDETLVANIHDKLISEIESAGSVDASHMTHQTSFEAYTDYILKHSMLDSKVSSDVITETREKYTKYKSSIFKKLTR